MTNYSIENYSKKFELLNKELRAYWMIGRDAARNVGIKINELVSFLHKEHPDWNIKKIAYTIAATNDDLTEDGFSYKTVYIHLNEDHKALLDPSKQNKKNNNNDEWNNVLEENVYNSKHKLVEDSSTTPTIYEEKDVETEYENRKKGIENEENLTHDRYDNNNDENEQQKQKQQSNIELVTKENERLKQENEEYQQKIQELSIIKIRENEIKKQLPEEVVKIAEDVELSTKKLELLLNPRLKKHPKLQEALVYKVQDSSPQKARDVVHQIIHNLETGYVKEDKETYTVHDIDAKEDIKKESNKIVQLPTSIDIIKNGRKILELLTGHKLENGEFRYTNEIIENTKKHRIDIIKSCNSDYRELDTLLSDILKPIQMVVRDMIPKIYDELDIVKQKQEMMKE